MLPSITVKDAGADRVIFALPPTSRPDLDSVTAFALHKSGSVLLNNILRDLCRQVGLTYVGLPQECFRLGMPINDLPATTSDFFLRKGYCYAGFRLWPNNFHIPIISISKPILLVRDPRDRLVSHYYSMRESHVSPGNRLRDTQIDMPGRTRARSLDVDGYARATAPLFLAVLKTFRRELCETYEIQIYRYEEVIYRKAAWVEDLVEHFRWDVSRGMCAKIAEKYDTIPSEEDVSKHIRQVHPGNFRKNLSQETIAYLNGLFKKEMTFFGYDLD